MSYVSAPFRNYVNVLSESIIQHMTAFCNRSEGMMHKKAARCTVTWQGASCRIKVKSCRAIVRGSAGTAFSCHILWTDLSDTEKHICLHKYIKTKSGCRHSLPVPALVHYYPYRYQKCSLRAVIYRPRYPSRHTEIKVEYFIFQLCCYEFCDIP